MARVRRLPVGLLLPILGLALAAAGEDRPAGRSARSVTIDAGLVPWTRLEFEARKLFLKGRSELRLASVASAELDGQLISSPDGGDLQPASRRTALLELDSSFAGRRSEVKLWLDPRDATALQRLKRRLGKKAYQKTYRFTRGGVFSRRLAPDSESEAERPVDSWSDLHETFYPHPAGHRDCPLISEPTVLFYLISAVQRPRDGVPVRFCVFSDKVLNQVELRPTGKAELAVDYRRSVGAKRDRRHGKVQVSRFVVEARPVDPNVEGSFELLGLEGDVELFFDGRVPVQVSGRVPGLGSVDVKLCAADLRHDPS